MTSIIEREHLDLLREIERRGSLTAAAKSLALTQSALSHTVKKLERSLGVTIWLRDGRGLRLTQAGEYLLALSNRLLPQFEHAEETMQQFASGKRGTLRIGMECHPCYQWLLKVVAPYMLEWPDVELDVRQKFQFGGIGAIFNQEIDILVTPDPLKRKGLEFIPVFDYEQVLVVGTSHPLAQAAFVSPEQLADETLITYPVEVERLDIYSLFLTPAQVVPKRRKVIETTDIMLQMVECGRGVAALPGWLVAEYAEKMRVVGVRLGREGGVHKHIYLGIRKADAELAYLAAFVGLARSYAKLGKKEKPKRLR